MTQVSTSERAAIERRLERAARSAKPALGHLSAGEGAHIPLTARSLSHCDWCAAVDAYLAARREAHYDEWLQTLREQAEERKS